MKKSIKILVGIIIFILIGGGLWLYNGFLGNPISKLIVKNSAKEYISQNYSDMKLEISDISYNFKDGDYHVDIKSPTSKDTHFSVGISPSGKIEYDSYEDNVVKKYNTYTRIDELYNSKVRDIFENEDFPYKSDLNFGQLREKVLIDPNDQYKEFGPQYGLEISELELDKDYNINELGKKYGHIVLYIQDEDVSIKRASEILIDIKKILDSKNVSFYAIDFTIEKPLKEDQKANSKEDSIGIQQFLYSDIYENGLENRIKEAYDNLQEYFKEQDKIKNEINK